MPKRRVKFKINNFKSIITRYYPYRFWRKNKASSQTECLGVDLNRNFDINWSQFSSNDTCHETYHGLTPFSEPETIVIRDIFHEYVERLKLFIDIHSYGSKILYSYGNGSIPYDGADIHNIGIIIANAIDSVKLKDNPNYEVGNSALVLYKSSGSTEDYSKFIGIPYSYTIEMPGYRFTDVDVAGFLVEPKFIKQAGYETWQGIVAGARRILRDFGQNHKSVSKNN